MRQLVPNHFAVTIPLLNEAFVPAGRQGKLVPTAVKWKGNKEFVLWHKHYYQVTRAGGF
jgi:hypothetical protein